MAQKVELRKRSGGSFSGNDNLMLPVTHVNYVLGLLDGNEKLNTSLLPDSMLNTKRMAGTINTDTNFSNLYNLVKEFNDHKKAMNPGTYFIANGKRTISASTDHVVQYNDDGLPEANSVVLEHGDHLFYVQQSGSSYAWSDTGDTVSLSYSNGGIADLSAPYNLIKGEDVFANHAAAVYANPSDSGIHALVTGYQWDYVSAVRYDNAQLKIDKTANLGREATLADANYVVIPGYPIWNSVPEPGDGNDKSIVLRLENAGFGYSYFELERYIIGEEPETATAKVYESVEIPHGHIWGVVNNSYDLATSTSAGLMSAADKAKLNSLSNYSHPTHQSINFTSTGVNFITKFTSDSLGHVTKVVTEPLPNASTSAVGVVELATTSEGQTATDGSRALTPASGLAMLNYNQDVSYFANLTTANAAELPDGATAIISTGSIIIP